MPYANIHSARIHNPDDFKQDSFKTVNGGSWVLPGAGRLDIPSTIEVVVGHTHAQTGDEFTVQTLHFPIDNFSAEEAKKWLKDNKVEYISFERAVPTKSNFRNKISSKTVLIDNGFVEGYASTWDVDLQNEQVIKGAYSKSIREVVAAQKVPLMVRHIKNGGDILDCVGLLTWAKEDDIGLYIHADFDSTILAQEIRQKVVDHECNYFSISFRSIQGDFENGIYVHKEAAIVEVTLTLFPANLKAEIIVAKSIKDNSEAPLESTSLAGFGTQRIWEYRQFQLDLTKRNLR